MLAHPRRVVPFLALVLVLSGCGSPYTNVLIRSPNEGEQVVGVVRIEATVFGEPDTAALTIDGTEVDDYTDGLLAYDWDTSEAAAGSHTIGATASSGNVARVDSRNVVVARPPTVSLDAVDGATLSGDATIEVDAADDDAIDHVEISLDGGDAVTDDDEPYRFALDTCDLSIGEHTLSATAVDSADLTATATATFDVRQEVDVVVTTVAGRAEASQTITADVTWEEAASQVSLFVDGTKVGSLSPTGAKCPSVCPGQCQEYEGTVDSTSLSEGSHVVKVRLVDSSGSSAEDSVDLVVTFDADGDGDVAVPFGGGDCDDDNDKINSMSVDTVDGLDNDCTGHPDDLWWVAGGADGDHVGMTVAWAGDFDNDGKDDILVGSYSVEDPSPLRNDRGALYLVSPGAIGEIDAAALPALVGGVDQSSIGDFVIGLGDVDGDGVDDVAVSQRGTCSAPLAVMRGPLSGVVATSSAWATYGFPGGTGCPFSGDGDDIDGDGDVDLVLGAPVGDRAVLYRGPLTAGGHTSPTTSFVRGSIGDYTGYDVSFLGDLDGDGRREVSVSAPTGMGAVFVWRDPPAGSVALADADAFIWGDSTLSLGTGRFIADPGDLDGDGRSDVALTANGRVFVHAGPLPADSFVAGAYLARTTSVADVDPVLASGAFDGDGDGEDDLVVGVAQDPTAGSFAGAVFVEHSPVAGTNALAVAADRTLYGASEGDFFGSQVLPVGDVNGDGRHDLAIGAWGAGVNERGEVRLLLSP